ncbi:MAG: hypothetical protein KIT72_00800 [Polyangiaceae bacterium]|nr:hypothetical protein [Polyangiaceae bacterium]MCW5788934.1 hypothetical protein [Polyangiaceae bacterium]
MKLSLLMELPEGEPLEALTQRYQAELETHVGAEEADGEAELTVVPLARDERPLFVRQLEALPQASGCFIAAFDAHVTQTDGWLGELLTAHAKLRDPDISAVFSERAPAGGEKVTRLIHRGLCRLSGRRSPPRELGTAALFDRRWVPALTALPPRADLDLPLALASVGAEWHRVWHRRALSATPPKPPLSERVKFGFRRFSWLGGLRELAMLIGLGLYGFCGILIVSGPRSAWAAKGWFGVALLVLLTLIAGLVQWLIRRPLRPALALGSETVAEIESHRRAKPQ